MTTEPADQKQQRLQHWVQHLSDQEMPAFAHTARLITGEAARDDRSAAELARVILQDASMTTRLLRVANSIAYNPARGAINTISRAIVVLGFDTVRNLCLSIAIIDTLVAGEDRARVLEEMAQSFHAAVQARSLAEKRRDKSPEEIFIAALLVSLGRMAFWCFADKVDAEAGSALRQAMADGQTSDPDAERRILGFTLNELTLALNREWHLSHLLDTTLSDNAGQNPRVSNISLGHEIAARAREGWDSAPMRKALERTAESLYLPREQVVQLVHENARDAASTMANLGARKAGALIPKPDDLRDSGREPAAPEETRRERFLQPDRELQLSILGELSQLLAEEQPAINLVLEMVLEGIYRGVGMDRTLIALLSADRKSIRAKQTLGWDRQELGQRFHFRVTSPPQQIMDHVIEQRRPLWVQHPPQREIARLVTPDIEQIAEGSGFFVMPLEVRDRVIGLLYADRHASRRPLDDASFGGFRLFGQQANLGLSFIKGR